MSQRENVTIIDFGGGTGRWLQKLDKYFKNSKFIIVDLSEDMLSQAKEKVRNKNFTNEVSIVHSNIKSIPELVNETADYVISTYNPLSFCDKPQLVINEAFRVLKKNGVAMITIQGYYNALYSKINNFLADPEELDQIFRIKKVKWNDLVPSLWQLSQEDMEDMFSKSTFSNIHSRGIACLTQPQAEDFDPENKLLGSLSKKLNTDKNFYDTVLVIELEAGKQQGAINRAMNILTVGTKL